MTVELALPLGRGRYLTPLGQRQMSALCLGVGRVAHLMRSWDVMRVKGLVWLGIPAQDYAGAVRFFREVLGLAVAFDEPDTVGTVRRER